MKNKTNFSYNSFLQTKKEIKQKILEKKTLQQPHKKPQRLIQSQADDADTLNLSLCTLIRLTKE